MAELVKVFEIDIDATLLVKSTEESRKVVTGLKDSIKELSKAEKENNKAIAERLKKLEELKKAEKEDIFAIAETEVELNKLLDTQEELNSSISEQTLELKLSQKELNQNVKLSTDLIAANEAQTGSIEQMRKQLSVVTVQWAKLSKEERENTDRGKALTKQKKELTEELKAEEKATGDTRRNVGNYSDAINEALPGMGNFISSIQSSTKAALAFIATPLGAVLAAIVAVFKLLQGAFNRSLSSQEKMNKITGKLSAAFNTLLDILIPVVDFILDQVLTAFEQISTAVVFLIEKLEDWGIISQETSDKWQENMEKNTEAADNLANAERRLIQSSIALQKAQLRFQTQAEKLRQIRDDESKSIAERVAANEKLGKLLVTQGKVETAFAQQALDIAKQRQQLNGESLESIQEIGDAEIKLLEIRERITSQESEQLANLNSLRRDEAAKIKEQETKDAAEKKEADKLAAEESVRLLKFRIDKEKEFLDEQKQRKITNQENELALEEQNIFNQLDLQREGLEAQLQQEIEFAEKIGADVEQIERKFAKASIAIDETEKDAKLSLAADFAGNIATIAGEGTAIGKAAAVAQTTISTYQAATGAYASLAAIPVVGPALGIAAAAAAVAAGLANVKKILAVDTGLPGDNVSGSSAGGAASIPTSPQISGIAPTVNEGIVSRNNINVAGQQPISLQPTLLESDVEAAQKQNLANQETAVI